MKSRWPIIALLALFTLLGGRAYAKWTWTPWGGWFRPSDVAKGSPKQQFDYAKSLMQEGRYVEAGDEFLRLVAEYGYLKYAAEAQFMAGECYLNGGDYYRAFLAYEELLKSFPESQRLEDALRREYEIGDAFCSGTRRELCGLPILSGGETGVRVLNAIVGHDPYGELAGQALMRLGRYYMDKQDYAMAVQTYSRILDDYPASPFYADARYLRAVAHVKMIEGPAYDKRPMDKALEQLKDIRDTKGALKGDVPELIQKVNDTRAKADYDTARFYLRNGKIEAARIYLSSLARRYPGSRYAKMAIEVLQTLPPPEEEQSK